jgi:lactate permease
LTSRDNDGGDKFPVFEPSMIRLLNETFSVYLIWTAPVVVVVVLVASGRATSVTAGSYGLIISLVVALCTAPYDFGTAAAVLAVAQGMWLAILVGAVVFGGLFFREIVAAISIADSLTAVPANMRRRQLFNACFLLGPFAEAVTGYGVGQATIAPIIKRAGLAPIEAIVFGLFSQMMVPWSASANCTIVGAQLAGLAPVVLGTHSAFLTLPLIWGWLCLFWRFASVAGLSGTITVFFVEAALATVVAGMLILANMELGPEVAALAALSPLIALRFVFESEPSRARWCAAIRVSLPYAVLVIGMVATRAIQPLNQLLAVVAVVRPFAQGPSWSPFLHPSSWLLCVGCLTALATGRAASIVPAIHRAWLRGKGSVFTIAVFLGMAQVMTISGVAAGLAEGVTYALGPFAPLVTPLLAGTFGSITNSGSTTNGLLMSSQVALARTAHVSVTWRAAVQNVAGGASTMLSPARIAVGCALVGRADLERRVYSRAWVLGVVAIFILSAVASFLIIAPLPG